MAINPIKEKKKEKNADMIERKLSFLIGFVFESSKFKQVAANDNAGIMKRNLTGANWSSPRGRVKKRGIFSGK